MINPLEDGIDHINIYSKGKTELGRLLSNFANTPIAINGTRYQCLEGYWYDRGIAWPKHQEMVVIGDKRLPITSFTKSPEIEKEHKSLQTANGFKAKEIGKALHEKYGITEDLSFQQAIGFAMESKIQQHPKIAQLLKDSSLPFEHYYVYGDVVRDAGFKWILEKWMEIRDKLQAPDAKAWLDKHQDLFSSIPDQVLPNERKESGTTSQKEIPMTKRYYAGIGSRQTPVPVLEKMTQIATALAKKGYTLRSGGAQGADRAFESGAVDKEIFRPEGAPNWAMKLVQKYVPASYKWNSFKLYTKQLQARNMQILLGENGDSPVEFVICWTPDGKDSGGTGYGLRCAVDKGIPIFNLKNEGVLEQLRWFYKNL